MRGTALAAGMWFNTSEANVLSSVVGTTFRQKTGIYNITGHGDLLELWAMVTIDSAERPR